MKIYSLINKYFYVYIMHLLTHYNDVMMGAMASQIAGVATVWSTVGSGADQRKDQSSASQKVSDAENTSIWWRHHAFRYASNNLQYCTFVQVNTVYRYILLQLSSISWSDICSTHNGMSRYVK